MNTRPATASAWRTAIANLTERRERAEVKIAEIDSRRGEFVLAAQLGDEAARSKVEEYDTRLDDARRQGHDLERALSEAEAELRAAEEREATARRERDLAEAEKLEREAQQIAARLDGAIEHTASDAQEVKRLLIQAGRLRGASTSHVANRMELAVRAAYWHRHLKVGDYVEAKFRRPLVENLTGLLGLRPPADR